MEAAFWHTVLFHPDVLSICTVNRGDGTVHLSVSLKRLPLPRVKLFDGPREEVAERALRYIEGVDR